MSDSRMYWIGSSRYPFASFKFGETVYAVNESSEYEWVGRMKNNERRYESCVLVCDAKQKKVGYVPKSHFVGFADGDMLESVKKDAIGKTFDDDNGGVMRMSGDELERMVVTFIDDQNLTCTRGNYFQTISEKETGGYIVEWVEDEIFETQNYTYNFSVTPREEVLLDFNGQSYEVVVNMEDYTISNIIFYPKEE